MSITHEINKNLPYISLASIICLIGIFFFRVIRIFSSALVSAIITVQYNSIGLNFAKSALQKYAHNSLYGHALSFIINIVNSLLNIVVIFFRACLLIIYMFLPILILALVLIIINENWNGFLIFIAETFNTSWGTTLRTLVLFPLQLLEIITSNLIPIFNLLVYIIIQIPIHIIFWIAQGQGKDHLVSFLTMFAGSFPVFTNNMQYFINNHTTGCVEAISTTATQYTLNENRVCMNSSLSAPVDSVFCSLINTEEIASICFEPKRREIDLNQGFVLVQQSFGHGIMMIGSSCDAISLLANITFFPLIDPFFWNSVDRFGNAVFNGFISAPMTAIQRCKLAGGLNKRPSMCTPDFGPFFDMLVEASILLGKAITNWIDVLYLFLFDTRSGSIFDACNVALDFADVFNDNTLKLMMGSNSTVLVKTNSETFALTDGYSIMYVNHDGPIRKSYFPQAWPLSVNTKYGIARSILPYGDESKDGGIGLLGCSCNDTQLQGQLVADIKCAIVTRSGNSWILPVDWSLSTEIQLLTCSRIRIVVQSLRKPHQRVVVSELGNSKFVKSCDSKNCLIGDVAIYVVPVCGSSDPVKAMACFPEKYFTRGICFPYCMAIHMKNEQKQPIKMRGASEWEQGVVIANRDCTPPVKLLDTNDDTEINDDNYFSTTCLVQSEQTVSSPIASDTFRKESNTVSVLSTCSFSTICTTSIRNKSMLADYRPNMLGSTPIIQDNSPITANGVRLSLDLQPLVIAGEVQMRKYSKNNEYIVDFPTIVGNQYNEFTIEFYSEGIPVVTDKAPVPRDEHKYVNKYPGQLYIPQALAFSQLQIPFSPAVLTSDSLWYATNPSYEWMYAMINYCSTKGAFTQTQVMILSSYSPMRLWKVQYQNTGCYMAMPELKRICSPSVSVSFEIDPENEVPLMSSNATMKSTLLMDLCLSPTKLNLWVESIEDYDEYNIVLMIKRGSMDDMGYLLNNHDVNKGVKSRGSTAYYFVSKITNENRENVPWTKLDYFKSKNLTSPSTSIFRMTCPKLRVLPDIGKFVGYSMAAVFDLLRVPVNFILNPFAVQEILTSRYNMRCPENSFRHSALEDCGMKLFSLNSFFQNMFKANEVFWNLISWLIYQILGGSDGTGLSKQALVFNQFLQGGVVLGDATRLISMFEITRSVEFLDTGIEQVLFRSNRRRLLEDEDDGSERKSASGIFGHLTSFLSDGLGSLFSMTTSFASAVAGDIFSGANIGMILAGQDPILNVIGTSLTVPPLAWAQLTYEGSIPIILDILAHAQNKQFTFKPLWVHLYDTIDKYDDIVHERHKRACTGYRLMLGYGSSLGKGIYYNCLAASEMPRGIWTVALTIFVDMNLYRCMCVNPAGQNYKEFLFQNCEYLVSNNRKGLWQNILSSNDIDTICKDYSRNIETQLYGAFDLWMKYSLYAAESMTSFFDELFIQKSHTTDCNNINSNPTAIVLSPIPLNHFHVCSKTSSCQLRCDDAFQIFQTEYKRVNSSSSVDVIRQTRYFNNDIESPFFNRYDSDWSSSAYRTSNQDRFIRALQSCFISDIHNANHPCKKRCGDKTGYQCITSLTENIDLVQSSFEVSFFCLPSPSYLLATVFNTGYGQFYLTGINELITQEGMKVTYFEFSIQNVSTTYLYMYSAKQQGALSMDNQYSKLDATQIYLWKDNGMGGANYVTILSSVNIMGNVLNSRIKTHLFGKEFEVLQSDVLGCAILSTVEIFTGIQDQFLIYFSFNVQIKAWLKRLDSVDIFDFANVNTMSSTTENYILHGMLYHCDDNARTQSINCRNEVKYFVPCSYCESNGNVECQLSCAVDIDRVIEYSNQGSLLHMNQNTYFYLPSNRHFDMNNAYSDTFANQHTKGKVIEIFPYSGLNKRYQEQTYNFNENSKETISTLGSWSRSDVFSTTFTSYKPVRDTKVYRQNFIYYFQVDGGARDTSIASEWLEQARIQLNTGGYIIKPVKSATTNRTSRLIINCGIHSCDGCGTARLRLFCYAAEMCAKVKCIGTVVQTRNVFCGLGGVLERMSIHATLTWKAIYMSAVEIGLVLMRGLAGEIITEVSLKFPTDQFYALICSCKDTYASMVGLGMSLIQVLSSNIFGDTGLVQGLSLSGGNEDIGVLMGEKTLKAASVGGLFFNMLTGSTLVPTMALHKFLICTVNSTLMKKEEEGSLTIEFEDVAMDDTWLACSRVSGLSSILNNIDITNSLQSSVEMFTSFALSLLSGIGETVLYALQLSFDSSIDFFVGLTWSLEDIVETFNMKKCKVPNYALRYVLYCACDDQAYRIPPEKRKHDKEEGALWCVGTLTMNLVDGTPNAIIYNPYNLDTLSDGIKGVTKYIECLSNTYDPVSCEGFRRQYDLKLQVLISQGVEPISVWAKCKANYNNGVWDSGSGALFIEDMMQKEITKENPFLNVLTLTARNQWIEWARGISKEFLACMQEPSRLQIDYSTCMREYFNVKFQQTPNAYFLYQKEDVMNTMYESEPADACHVFTGIAKRGTNNTPLKTIFQACTLEHENIANIDKDLSSTSLCDLNPTTWSSSKPQKLGVARFHGTIPPWKNNNMTDMLQRKEIAMSLYRPVVEKLKRQWSSFNDSFFKDSSFLDVALFSADGDFIHDFIDCMFLGPYTRTEFIPCDSNNILDCPFYARDENGGSTRNFTKCFGIDLMYNDTLPPYTCGSKVRRSLIKYFYREIVTKQNLGQKITNQIYNEVMRIFLNYTSQESLGCYDRDTGSCSLGACSLKNGFSPCLDTNFIIDSEKMSKFLLDHILNLLPDFYRFAMQDSAPWSLYAEKSGPIPTNPLQSEYPFQWKKNKKIAEEALNLGHMDPNLHLIEYGDSEVFSMPLFNASDRERRLGSIWSTCMSLLGQPSLTIPVENNTFRQNRSFKTPVGFWDTIIKFPYNAEEGSVDVDFTDMTQLERIVRNMIRTALKSHSPFIWHRHRRHAPSHSNFCKKSKKVFGTSNPGKIYISDLKLFYQKDGEEVRIPVAPEPNLHMHFFGFYERTIGESHLDCVCGRYHNVFGEQICEVGKDTCSSFLDHTSLVNMSTCSTLYDTCQRPLDGKYYYGFKDVNNVRECLRNSSVNVRCPEFGLSDIWGFFPVDCSTQECDIAKSWISTGNQDLSYEAIRFLSEGRGGMRISNYRHHNMTYHLTMNHKVQKHKPEQYSLEKCMDISELSISEENENEMTLIDSYLSRLFPVVQMVFESHVTASCSRFLIEIARVEMLEYMSSSSIESQLLEAMKWKRKCETKLRHFIACNTMGLYFDIVPPSDWQDIAYSRCDIALLNLPVSGEWYMSPWCVLINRRLRKIYDTHKCIHNIPNRYPDTSDINAKLWVDFSVDNIELLDCEVHPSPFMFIRESEEEIVPLSMVFTCEQKRLIEHSHWIEELVPGLSIEDIVRHSTFLASPTRDHVSHIYDWWPDDVVNFPIGFHVSAATDLSELAPSVFDSHYLFDSDASTMFYTHTSLRNNTLLHENLGACGICRSETIGMPIFESNTNRICTRLSKHASSDVPTHPVLKMKHAGGNSDMEWPFSSSFIEENFYNEYCADSSFDVPWKNNIEDILSQTAGGMAGWPSMVSLDSSGRGFYDFNSEPVFPPKNLGYRLHDMNEETIFSKISDADMNWGPCTDVVRWEATLFCDVENDLQMCPDYQSTCLRFNESTTKGICYPSITYAASIQNEETYARYPCFASFHCPDNFVCLADGGCSPLYLHVWNNEKDAIEVSVIADSCGFIEEKHPYTQTFRGASPWEHVPDILHVHGFCSHHDWFSYRHAIKTQQCQLERGEVEFLRCDPNTTYWPWVFETFDKKRPTDTNAQSMSQEKTLLVKPHPCDQRFMHLQNPFNTEERLKVCSGYQGRQNVLESRNVEFTYEIQDTNDGWRDVHVNNARANNTIDRTWWMRTYEETSNELNIGMVGYSAATDVPLGFLGADRASETVLHDMSYSDTERTKFKFFRCVDRYACSMPLFRYNGLHVVRLDPLNMKFNLSEMSLRYCGSIGFLPKMASGELSDVCALDLNMFPIFISFIWKRNGCSRLFGESDQYMTKFKIIMKPRNVLLEYKAVDISDSQSIVCEDTFNPSNAITFCIYRPRSSSVLSEESESDHVSQIQKRLNDLILNTPNIISGSVSLSTVGKKSSNIHTLYGSINECSNDIQNILKVSQINIQKAYESLGTSGLYIALKLSLYEISISWLRHVWLVSLLSAIDARFKVPNMNDFIQLGNMEVPLWGDKSTYCDNQEDLERRPFLLTLICKNWYVDFTFYSSLSNVLDFFREKLVMTSKSDIQQKLFLNRDNLFIKCYERARWKCDSLIGDEQKKCFRAWEYAHNTTSRKSIDDHCPVLFTGERDSNFPFQYFDPCRYPELFEFDRMIELPQSYMNSLGAGTFSNSINDIQQTLRQSLLSYVEDIVEEIDFISRPTMDVLDDDQFVNMLKITSLKLKIDTQTYQVLNFDFQKWFQSEVCPSAFAPNEESICKWQENIDLKEQCLYPYLSDYSEFTKFSDNSEYVIQNKSNMIRIEYGNEEVHYIDVCKLIETNDPNKEACIVQYLGDRDRVFHSSEDEIPCQIRSIYVPQGIEVQAFAFKKNRDQWLNMIDNELNPYSEYRTHTAKTVCEHSKDIRSCTWKYNPESAIPEPNRWWFGDTPTSGRPNEISYDNINAYMDHTKTLAVDFGVMNEWWASNKDLWNNEGCGTYSHACALKFRFENIPKLSRAVCTRGGSPNCANIVSDPIVPTRAYATSSDTDVANRLLYRCAPCTRGEKTISDKGLFGCHMRDSSGNPVPSMSSYLSQSTISQYLPYLENKDDLKKLIPTIQGIELFYFDKFSSILNNIKALFVSMKIHKEDTMNAVDRESIAKYMKTDKEEICASDCNRYEKIDMTSTKILDQLIWNEAIKNPSKIQTMVCDERRIQESDLNTCNKNIDKRRTNMKKVADVLYKKKNGVWLHKVNPKMGLAWQANVAHKDVNMFSLMYASSVRPEREVKTSFALSDTPCSTKMTQYQDRICVQSLENTQLPFEPMHPWVGGDFNPFEGSRGHDECIIQNSLNSKTPFSEVMYEESMLYGKITCPCKCEPDRHCRDLSGRYNYTTAFMNSEFSDNAEFCNSRSFSNSYTMNTNDESNICAFVKKPITSDTCLHKQGILGGFIYSNPKVEEEQFHSHTGVKSAIDNFLIQTMYGNLKKNGLWKGKTLLEEQTNQEQYAFLKMSRNDIHPAHIAFAIDPEKSGQPFVLKSMILLPYTSEKFKFPHNKNTRWLDNMQGEWNTDMKLLQNMYPHIEKVNNMHDQITSGHWSCPFRIASFWGNANSGKFSPMIPNPLLSKMIYPSMNGAHPLVRSKSVYHKLKTYKTTNGICFYESEDSDYVSSSSIYYVHLEDANNPCGIKQILWHLNEQTYSMSRVMNHFHMRCNDIIDFPGLNATLRNDEYIYDPLQVHDGTKCGVLHRLTPFLMRTKGNASIIIKHRKGLTTSSDGGDCHMGRAFKYSLRMRNNLVGRHCSLVMKTSSLGIVRCTGLGNTRDNIVLERSVPYTLEQIKSKKNRFFKSELLKRTSYLKFQGPGVSNDIPPEVSYGLHMSVSLARMLAEDLKYECEKLNHPDCVILGDWKGKNFIRQYMTEPGKLVSINKKVNYKFVDEIKQMKAILYQGIIKQNPNDTLSSYLKAKLIDDELWNTKNWTWSYYASVNNTTQSNASFERAYMGTVDKQEWRKDRFQACNKSHHHFFENTANKTRIMDFTTMRVSLCEPAPTSSLQSLCESLLQFRQEISLINCQVMGNNDCLYAPGMFYLPYEWSTTNQQFSTQSVYEYYSEIVKIRFQNESMANVCPSRNDIESNMIKLSIETRERCPATQIEFLKDTLSSIRSIGKDILYMGYCLIMFVVNILGLLFAKSGEASAAMQSAATTYATQFFVVAQTIIMPILNAFIDLLFGTSSAGKIISDIIMYLCKIYNWFMNNIVVYLWCTLVMPQVYILIQILKAIIGTFSSEVNNVLDTIWNVIGGGHNGLNVQACIGRMKLNLVCEASEKVSKYNASGYRIQPLATRCWVDAKFKNGYSNVFGGSSEFSYLSCTLSDTCSLSPLHFDDYDYTRNNLIPCSSCPDIDVKDGYFQKFGCNAYIKRCTCSTNTLMATECMSNKDCLVLSDAPICSMASTIDMARVSFTTTECSSCGALGQSPICVFDGSSTTGVCSCGTLDSKSFLSSCSEDIFGDVVPLLDNTKQCFISPNRDIMSFDNPVVILDFNDLAIGPCALGTSNPGGSFCLKVVMPLQSGFTEITRNYVVIMNSFSPINNMVGELFGISRRRLLSIHESTNNVSLDTEKNVQIDILNQIASNCSKYSDRESIKDCIYWKHVSWILHNNFHIGTLHTNPDILLESIPQFLFNSKLRDEILSHDLARKFLVESYDGFIPSLLNFAYEHTAWILLNSNLTLKWPTNANYSHKCTVCTNKDKVNRTNSHNRKLHQIYNVPVAMKLPAQSCTGLEKPFHDINHAFWETIRFYNQNNRNLSSSIIWYEYPPLNITSHSIIQNGNILLYVAFQFLSLTMSGGSVPGEQIWNSFTVNISNEESLERNYFTGTRFSSDMAKCNYTTLTFGPNPPREILPWFLLIGVFIFIISSFCCTSTILSWFMWFLLFPIVLFWTVYNISPLCWPMIPPKFPHDMVSEISKLLPTTINIPYFLINSECLSIKRVSNGNVSRLIPTSRDFLSRIETQQDRSICFKKCTEDPFLMKSWQDPLAWWTCELSTDVCKTLASAARGFPVLKDFASSAFYFSDVLLLKGQDAEFVQAHRFCAIFTSHEIIMAFLILFIILIVTPTIIQLIFQFFTGAIVLIVHSSNAEIDD